MAKKKEEGNLGKKEVKEVSHNNELYEKLRDELFQYRVEIQSYKRSINIIIACTSVLVGMFVFFGIDRVDSLMKKYEERAELRLAKTDSLLSQVDVAALDSLSVIVAAKTEVYNKAISELEKGTRVNKELYTLLIKNLPSNPLVKKEIKSYIDKSSVDYFDIVEYPEIYKKGQKGECYIVLSENVTVNPDDVLVVSVYPKDRRILVYHQTYSVQGVYNKTLLSFDKYERYLDYTLSITLLRKEGNDYIGYSESKPIHWIDE